MIAPVGIVRTTLGLPADAYAKICTLARQDHRSIAGMLRVLVLAGLRHPQRTSDPPR